MATATSVASTGRAPRFVGFYDPCNRCCDQRARSYVAPSALPTNGFVVLVNPTANLIVRQFQRRKPFIGLEGLSRGPERIRDFGITVISMILTAAPLVRVARGDSIFHVRRSAAVSPLCCALCAGFLDSLFRNSRQTLEIRSRA